MAGAQLCPHLVVNRFECQILNTTKNTKSTKLFAVGWVGGELLRALSYASGFLGTALAFLIGFRNNMVVPSTRGAENGSKEEVICHGWQM
ncbi:hypothetical protein [Billgrantia montanilacus]|uniref:Uncharacterized protein n=1 Tax=Billgrantia montanilacus TaxID=2282305 RepID=A0A368TPR2_9GAMM|nr:hypothetical protein [Halomonas montanilacus]RCV86558.1 hypothetical protein DU505_20360 [Halomonas montanilacus]